MRTDIRRQMRVCGSPSAGNALIIFFTVRSTFSISSFCCCITAVHTSVFKINCNNICCALFITNVCRYAADEHMAVDKQQMENSVQILRKVGLVPDTFATEQLWSNKAGVANTVITVN